MIRNTIRETNTNRTHARTHALLQARPPPTPKPNRLLHQDFFLQDHWLGNTGVSGKGSKWDPGKPTCMSRCLQQNPRVCKKLTAGPFPKGHKQE